MKKCWKIIRIVALTVFILGLICIGVGALTGADYARVFSVLDDKFQIERSLALYRQQNFAWSKDLFTELLQNLR